MSAGIPFVKMQGIGNDFMLVDGRLLPEMDWSALSLKTGDRHFGVGHDGLLVVLNSAVADFRMRMFNPDGSEDMCGNGLRCVVRYLWDQSLVVGREVSIESLTAIRRCRVVDSGSRFMVSARMGVPELDPATIGVLATGDRVIDHPIEVAGEVIPITAVRIGALHGVMFGPLPSEHELVTLGPAVECHPIFPDRANIDWVEVLGPEKLAIRTWERGAGATLACGTGATAAVVAARLRGEIGDRAEVVSPGGTLEIEWDGRGEAVMIGPAEPVYTGVWR